MHNNSSVQFGMGFSLTRTHSQEKPWSPSMLSPTPALPSPCCRDPSPPSLTPTLLRAQKVVQLLCLAPKGEHCVPAGSADTLSCLSRKRIFQKNERLFIFSVDVYPSLILEPRDIYSLCLCPEPLKQGENVGTLVY